MGVQGLLSFCLRGREQCSELVDLVEVARQQQGIELLADFYSFEHLLLANFWSSLSKLRGNEYLLIAGGEYGSIDRYITKFIEDFKSLGISFVFFIDGSKGSSTEVLRQKLDTWLSRHEENVKKLDMVVNVCRGVTNMSDLPPDVKVRPVLLETQVIDTLRGCGCEVLESAAGEVDLIIARALTQREKAYAVMSNDSDFCIFPGSRFIPNELFDLHNDLQLGQPGEVTEKPLRLMSRVITMEKVISLLGVADHKMLVELSIVAGNDFTGPFLRRYLRKRLDCRPGFQGAVDLIQRYKHIQNHPMLSKEMDYNKDFRAAVHHSRNFYTLKGEPDRPPNKGYFSQLIAERISAGKLPGSIMAMHNNFYWHRMLLEDNSYGQPCIECTLAMLRSFIYRIVLPRQESLVNEYGRSPWDSVRKAGILAAEEGTVPAIHQINPDKIFNNLRTFHNIMSHLERRPPTNWFDRYGRKNGFIMYVLRYMLMISWRQNIHISEDEFLALVVMAFSHAREDVYQTIVIRPTPRCVTIGNWFQDVYRHAYAFLGNLLHIRHECPTPMEIFSGSAWTAFYMCSKDDTFRKAATQVPQHLLLQTQQHMNAVLKEKRHMVRYLVEGFFPFEDR